MMRNQWNVAVLTAVLASVPMVAQGSKEGAVETADITGKQLFTSYCALCHGSDGKGGGPFSPQLKVWPPDLTTLAKKNGGLFPAMRVAESIDGEFAKPSHGSSQMPIWGPVFRSMAHGKKDSALLRIDSLVKYIESLQEK